MFCVRHCTRHRGTDVTVARAMSWARSLCEWVEEGGDKILGWVEREDRIRKAAKDGGRAEWGGM